MARSLFTEFYVQNSHYFEYFGIRATDFNDFSLIREPSMSHKLQNYGFSDCRTGEVCISLWWRQFKFKLAVP